MDAFRSPACRSRGSDTLPVNQPQQLKPINQYQWLTHSKPNLKSSCFVHWYLWPAFVAGHYSQCRRQSTHQRILQSCFDHHLDCVSCTWHFRVSSQRHSNLLSRIWSLRIAGRKSCFPRALSWIPAGIACVSIACVSIACVSIACVSIACEHCV